MMSRSLIIPARLTSRFVIPLVVLAGIESLPLLARADDLAPKAEERQLRYAMHAKMSQRPTIRVGRSEADMVGADHRVLQAAVNYVANLGGGTVEIGEGEYLMGDSLHLRSEVTIRGRKGKTILRKAEAAVSPLAIDGDFGEQQVTVREPEGFRRGPRGRDLGRPQRRVPHHGGADHRAGRESVLDRRRPDVRLHGLGPCASGDRVPGGQRHGYPAARVEDLVIEGNKGANPYLNGCRGAGIYLYRGSAWRSGAAWCGTTTATGSASSNPTT